MSTLQPANLGRALSLLHTHDVRRRAELTDALGLTRTATGSLLRELESRRLISVDSRPGAHGTGRPSHRIAIHPDAPVAVAVQVQAETAVLALATLGGTLGPVAAVPLPEPTTPDAVLALVATQIVQLLANEPRRCVGVGIGLPSAVGNGTALAALNLGWPSVTPVARLLGDLLGRSQLRLPVQVGNDANLAAIAEFRHGAGAHATDLLYVTTGQRGVGGGLVVGGQLHTGSAGYALEIGHLTVEPEGRPCHCGNRGCMDVEADPSALLRAAGLSPEGGAVLRRAREVLAAGRDASPPARAAVELLTRRLAVGLGSLVNVLNPDRVVLGNLYAELLEVAEGTLRGDLARRSFLDHAAQVELRPGRLADPVLVGAAEVAFQPLLDNPRSASQ